MINDEDFPIVSIGASAESLTALSRFFEHLPAASEMAFVVAVDLPYHQSDWLELQLQQLQQITALPVVLVTQRTPLEKNHLYIVELNKAPQLSPGFLNIDISRTSIEKTHAIDRFLREFGDIYQERALAVVFSGEANDCALGMRQIKDQGGLTFMQALGDTLEEHRPGASMPGGAADFIQPIADIAARLIAIKDNRCNVLNTSARATESSAIKSGDTPTALDGEADKVIQKIMAFLRTHTGRDFRQYTRSVVLSRLARRLRVRGIASLPAYQALLESDGGEAQVLLQELLIGATHFFRDQEAFDCLQREAIRDWCRQKPRDEHLRIWSPACGTGEEAYSIAMLLEENNDPMARMPTVQIFASDIDDEAIAFGRAGIYPASIVVDVDTIRLNRYFIRHPEGYKIHPTISEKILFASHNVLHDPPFSKLDLISCRNFLKHLNHDAQMHVLETFHFALNPGGILFLGLSESAEGVSNLFEPINKKNGLYRARASTRSPRRPLPGSHAAAATAASEGRSIFTAKPRFSYAEVHQRILLQHAWPSILIDGDDNIVHMSDTASRFLQHPGGEPSRNALTLVLPALRVDLRTALVIAKKNKALVESKPVQLQRHDKHQLIRMLVRPFRDDDAKADFLLVQFSKLPNDEASGIEPPSTDNWDKIVIAQLDAELRQTYEQFANTVERAEVSTEQLMVSNEELQATNEELRLATEELQTSKEELQSINEELSIVNAELKLNAQETGRVSNDWHHVTALTDIATLLVDRRLCVRRYTPPVTELFNIIGNDIGRPLPDITHKLHYATLDDDLAFVMESSQQVQRLVHDEHNQDFMVRIIAYRTVADEIDGAVLTFFNLTKLREAENCLARHVDQAPHIDQAP